MVISRIDSPFTDWLRGHAKLVIQVYCLLVFEEYGLPRQRLIFGDLLALHLPILGILEGASWRLLVLMNNHVSLLWLNLDLRSMNCPWLLIDDLWHVDGWANLHFIELLFIAISAIGENIRAGSPPFILYEPLQLLTMPFQGLIIEGRAETIMWKSCVLIYLPVSRDSRLPFLRESLLGPLELFCRDLWIFRFQAFCRRQVELQILISASDCMPHLDLVAKIGWC